MCKVGVYCRCSTRSGDGTGNVAWNETNDEALRPRFGTEIVPNVLMLVEDRPASLSALLLAADIARAQHAQLSVVHVQSPSAWRIAAGFTIPESVLRTADASWWICCTTR